MKLYLSPELEELDYCSSNNKRIQRENEKIERKVLRIKSALWSFLVNEVGVTHQKLIVCMLEA